MTVDRNKYLQRPNYYLRRVRTDGAVSFSFKLRTECLLRDAEVGINISIFNESSNSTLFDNFSFVVKNIDSDLGTIRLCTLGGIG